MFAMSMAMVATASAAPHWLHCEKGAAGTKYEDNNCSKANPGGEWAWKEVTGTEEVVSHGSLTLADIKVPVEGTVLVDCTGTDKGTVGPGKFDRITAIENIVCVAGTHCEKLEKAAEPLNLPWQTELVEENGTLRDKIKAENGKGAGWAVTCKVLGVTKTDECLTEEGSTLVENKLTSGKEQLVLNDFEEKSPKAKCSVGGAEAGEVKGTIALLQANKQGLAATK